MWLRSGENRYALRLARTELWKNSSRNALSFSILNRISGTNKKVIAKLLTIPLDLLQVSAHLVACLLLHGSTTTDMPKGAEMSRMEIAEMCIKMTSKKERGRTFGIAAVALGIWGFLISYPTLPFICFPASVACGVSVYRGGQRRWGGACVAMGIIGMLGFLFIMIRAGQI